MVDSFFFFCKNEDINLFSERKEAFFYGYISAESLFRESINTFLGN